jgi:Tfp pilus assembly protein PilO
MNLGSAQSNVKQQLAQYGIAAGVSLLVFVAGYFLFVSPESSKASALDKEISRQSAALTEQRADYDSALTLSKIQLADLFDLTRAMPDALQMADIIIQLDRLAAASGVDLHSISPSKPVALTGYQAVPVSVKISGNYFDLMEFLYDLRHLVDVRKSPPGSGSEKLFATGRLFDIDVISLAIATGASDPNRPQLEADLNMNVFVYGTGVVTGAPTSTSTTSTTTTQTTTTSGSGQTAAAPAQSEGGNG